MLMLAWTIIVSAITTSVGFAVGMYFAFRTCEVEHG